MAMTDHKITENMMENKLVTDAPDQPQGTAQQNKYLFDRLAKEVIIPAFNALIDSLTSAGGAGIGVNVPGVSGTTVQAVLNSMKTLIDGRYTKAQSDASLKSKTDPLIKSVGLDPQTGIWTFTKENGQTVTVDTNLEKIALDAKLDPDTKEFVLTLADGTEQRVSLSSFVRFLEFVGSDEIEFTTTGNTVKAGIKSGSIAEDKLNPALFSRLDTAVSTAESSAANAQAYAQKAQTQATNAAGSAVDAGIDAHNAETWTEGGQLMGEGGTLLPEHTTGAKEYAQMAQNSAGQAASSAANADTSKNAAAESAQRAEEAAKQAEEIAGGDFVTRSEFSLHTGDQEEHVTKEERTAWNAKLDDTQKGKAGGVASLDAQGKVPAGQLPEIRTTVCCDAILHVSGFGDKKFKMHLVLEDNMLMTLYDQSLFFSDTLGFPVGYVVSFEIILPDEGPGSDLKWKLVGSSSDGNIIVQYIPSSQTSSIFAQLIKFNNYYTADGKSLRITLDASFSIQGIMIPRGFYYGVEKA